MRSNRIFISVLLVFLFFIPVTVISQINYGTTGLMNMPTADMQRDKTFMAGGNWLNHHATVPRWWYDTWNYYINITVFPWLEAGYLCIGHKAAPVDYGNRSGFWIPSTYGKFVNQDRSFHLRFRIWKEGWWKQWTPQIVLGANDPGSHSDHGGGNITFDDVGENTNHLTRFYLAATKHFIIQQWGTLGIHASVIQFNGLDFDNEHGVAVGVNYRFNRPLDGFWSKALNGLNLMGEYYDGVFNVGGNYAIWKDRINLTASLYDGRYWSVGLFFKVCLK